MQHRRQISSNQLKLGISTWDDEDKTRNENEDNIEKKILMHENEQMTECTNRKWKEQEIQWVHK